MCIKSYSEFKLYRKDLNKKYEARKKAELQFSYSRF